MKLLILLLTFSYSTLTFGAITKLEFHRTINRISATFSAELKALRPKLEIKHLWDSPVVNAYASLTSEQRLIEVHGGLARFSHMTVDGFALLVCHELGHHLGGTPAPVVLSTGVLSAEGQADYFSTTKCLRRVYEKQNNERIIAKAMVPKSLADACSENFKARSEIAICIRSGLASLNASLYFAAMQQVAHPKIETPDLRVGLVTDKEYPRAQCRLDTLFQGAICNRSHQEPFSYTDERDGACHRALGDKVGMRPLCWFVPEF